MKKFEWLGIEKLSSRLWRGLPHNRALHSSDLNWFPKDRHVFVFGPEGQDDPDMEILRNEMRRIYNACSR